jgi:hypothetical protein
LSDNWRRIDRCGREEVEGGRRGELELRRTRERVIRQYHVRKKHAILFSHPCSFLRLLGNRGGDTPEEKRRIRGSERKK